MNFWKNHTALRFVLIAIFFVIGLSLTFVGWSMTGELAGLGTHEELMQSCTVYQEIYYSQYPKEAV